MQYTVTVEYKTLVDFLIEADDEHGAINKAADSEMPLIQFTDAAMVSLECGGAFIA